MEKTLVGKHFLYDGHSVAHLAKCRIWKVVSWYGKNATYAMTSFALPYGEAQQLINLEIYSVQFKVGSWTP